MSRFQTVAVRNYEQDGMHCTDTLRAVRFNRPGWELVLSPTAYSDLPDGERHVRLTNDEVRDWLNDCPDQVITIEGVN